MENFLNVSTNTNGERYYIMNFYYYKKVEYLSYKDLYEYDPVKEYLKLNKFMDTNIKNLENKLEENLQTCTQFINNTYVYIPQAICLVSRYPYAKQMETCLESILRMIIDSNVTNDEIYKFIQHLTCEIPVPPSSGKMLFFVPYNHQHIEIFGQKDLPLMNFNPVKLFDYFEVEEIITIHHLMLLEQKFLFVSKNISRLSEVTEIFLHVLFPMNWINAYIPVLSEELIKFLQFFSGFIMGIEESMLKLAAPYLDTEENIYIVNIDKGTIESNQTNKKGKKINRRRLSKSIPELPESNYKELSNELKKLKKNLGKLEKSSNKAFRDIFIKSMVMLFGDYKKYVSYIEDSPLFNTEILLKHRPSSSKAFYEELTQTQIFRYFLQQDRNIPNPYFENMMLKYNSSINTQRRSFSVKRTSTVVEAIENEHNTSHGNMPNIGLFSRKNSGVDNLNTDSMSSRIQNSDEMDQYMIRPFCLNDNTLSTKLMRIEEILDERYKHNNRNIKIIVEDRDMNFENIGKTFKRFVFSDPMFGRSKLY